MSVLCSVVWILRSFDVSVTIPSLVVWPKFAFVWVSYNLWLKLLQFLLVNFALVMQMIYVFLFGKSLYWGLWFCVVRTWWEYVQVGNFYFFKHEILMLVIFGLLYPHWWSVSMLKNWDWYWPFQSHSGWTVGDFFIVFHMTLVKRSSSIWTGFTEWWVWNWQVDDLLPSQP